MKPIDTILSPFAGLAKARKELMKKAKDAFTKSLKDFLEFRPEIQSLGWVGSGDNYDDNSYYFDINLFKVTLTEEAAGKHGLSSNAICYDNCYWNYVKDLQDYRRYQKEIGNFSGPLTSDLKVLFETIKDNSEYVKEIFGEFAEVTITKEGISSK